MPKRAEHVLNYWFGDDRERLADDRFALWFGKSNDTDEYIRENFGQLVEDAGTGKLDNWLAEPETTVAWIVLLDQFSRNIFRGSADMYKFDDDALAAAKAAVRRGFDFELSPTMAMFLYLPFEHAEDLACQDASVLYFTMLRQRVADDAAAPFDSFIAYAQRHQEVVARFGRFPHRNALLARESTPAEERFLRLPGSGF